MKKPDKLTIFVVFSVLVFATPLFALLSAAIYAKVWDMTLAKQYGDGPTYQSWYGISMFGAFLTMHLQRKQRDKDDEQSGLVAKTISNIVGGYVSMGVALLLVVFVCFALGWSR